MARRRVVEEPEASPNETVVPHDPVNEQVVIAAAMVDVDARTKLIKVGIKPDHFLEEKHSSAWAGIIECDQRNLDTDPATLQRILGDRLDVNYLVQLVEVRSDPISDANLDFAIEALFWDQARATAVRGPIASLVEAVKNPTSDPSRVRALAKHVGASFDGVGRRAFLRNPRELVHEHVGEMRKRMDGHATFPYGVQGIDVYEAGARNVRGDDVSDQARMLPGAAPGQVTVVTGVSGGGKSTLASGHMAIGLARQHRKVLIGAWEMGGGMTIELLACLSLGWSRSDLILGNFTEDNLLELEERAHQISKYVAFMENPFRRMRGERASNEKNLDLVQQHIEDSGAEVAIFDLWERCLENDDPGDEKRALFRQQAMAQETRTHHILLAQQRIKDIETRSDKRPTREGIKGSSAWVDVADTIIGVHRPALWKKMDDDVLEVFVLKQRYGSWPIGISLEWDPEFGSLGAGRSIPYEQPGEEGGEVDRALGMTRPKRGKRRG
jgi:archaellum biogenesis ATPase FlaH